MYQEKEKCGRMVGIYFLFHSLKRVTGGYDLSLSAILAPGHHMSGGQHMLSAIQSTTTINLLKIMPRI